MGFAASVSSSASSGFLSASSAFARGTTPWLAPLASWLQRRTPVRKAAPRQNQTQGVPGLQTASGAHAHSLAEQARVESRPLRVLRVVDGTPRQCAGRMVISGRMADVCAELDRLAAREMQRQQPPRPTHACDIRPTMN